MKVRIMHNDELFTTADEDTYAMVAAGAEEDNEVDISELSIHPDDIAPLSYILTQRAIDAEMKKQGITTRDILIWTGNLAVLNTFLISKLIKVGASQWEEDMPEELASMMSLADSVIKATEGVESITSVLSEAKVVTKALGISSKSATIVKKLLSNPVIPSLQ